MSKFSSLRDDALHFLCLSDWANESFGHVEAPSGYVWKISNEAADVSTANGEFNSVMEDWEASQDAVDLEALRAELVGHFIVREDSNGLVFVAKYGNEWELRRDLEVLNAEFNEWDEQGEG